MLKRLFQYLFFVTFLLFVAHKSNAQNSFVQSQKASFRVANAFATKEDTLQKEFKAKGLHWPAKYVYIRSFKYDNQLEIWVKNDLKEKYKLTFRKSEETETLSGYIINIHESIPREKDRIIIDDYQFDILKVSNTRIETVKLKVLR